MHRRSIQLIAGTTYAVSLPKTWVKQRHLKEKNELLLYEKEDGTLVVSPLALQERIVRNITLSVDTYTNTIDQIMFALYYLGIEELTLVSKKEISKEVRSRIRKTLSHMSGTEITYEDKQKITLKVFLDRSKIDIHQILYRISLIIDLSITNILEQFAVEEIRINEQEIDRLYHLIAKIVYLSLIDSAVLASSTIHNTACIPSYFLMSKRLENIGDDINNLAEYLHKTNAAFAHKKELLSFIKTELGRSMNFLLSPKKHVFEKLSSEQKRATQQTILAIKDVTIQNYITDILRYIIDIQEEIVTLSFYNTLPQLTLQQV